MDDNWRRQDKKPLWPNLVWAKPEQKNRAGKLLVIGGHLHGFENAARAYEQALTAGIGQAKVVLPDKLRPVLGGQLEHAVFAPSTAAGTLASQGRSVLTEYISWADTLLFTQTGENSETVRLIVELISHTSRPAVMTGDILNLIKHDAYRLLDNSKMLVLEPKGLQILLKILQSPLTVRHDMGLRPLVLAMLSEPKLKLFKLAVVYEDTIVIAVDGQAVTTKRHQHPDPVSLAAWLAVWWSWRPAGGLDALATAAYEF